MSTQATQDKYDIVVVGAGPAGSAAAGALGRLGWKVLLLEQTDGLVHDARLHSVNIRTMELARAWDLERALRRDCGWPEHHPQDVVWGTSLSEPEVARREWPAIARMTPPTVSPTFAQRCPQKWFNPIMRSFAARQPTVEVRLEHRVDTVSQDSTGAAVHVTDLLTGRASEVRARYVIAADGARSNIRRQIGVETIKSAAWGTSAETILRSPQISSFPIVATLGRFTLVEPSGTSISLLPFDGRDEYRLTLMVNDSGDTSREHISQAIRKLIGNEDSTFEFVTDVMPWTNRETLATTFRSGRVFLAGDAAHTMPTTLGLGMNTGIQDSFDLAWKLDAMLSGWGGEALLDSYDQERRTAVIRTSTLASSIYKEWVKTKEEHREFWKQIERGGLEAEQGRRRLGESLLRTFSREYNSIPASLGYHYENSPICIADGTPPVPDTLDEYIPNARPGHRAPHVWVEPGVSTLDLFGAGFTLLLIGQDDSAGRPWAHAAHDRGIPLNVHCFESGPVANAVQDAYEAAFVLVRPDGHVAWRSSLRHDDPGSILDVTSGRRPPAQRESLEAATEETRF